MGAVYLDVNECPQGDSNKQLLADLGEVVLSTGKPFFIGGDWNAEPDSLLESGWPRLMAAEIKAPATKTCALGQGSTLDYLVVSHGLSHTVGRIYTDPGAPSFPHHPMLVQIKGLGYWR